MYRLLVVDDEDIITDSLARMLTANTRIKLEVYKAYAAPEALELLKEQHIDIVVTDIEMPGMSGIELLREIRKISSNCAVIFLTGHDEFEYAYQALQYHVTRYIFKNEGDDVLLEAIAECAAAIDAEARNRELILRAEEQLRSFAGQAGTEANDPEGELEGQYEGLAAAGPEFTSDMITDRLLGYIRKNLDGDLSLNALAGMVFLNPSYLSRRFKEVTGKNIADTVMELRVTEACRLLDSTLYRINKIAGMVGYSSPPQFARMFRRRTGMSPQEYRNKR